jgi:hypothetical protein
MVRAIESAGLFSDNERQRRWILPADLEKMMSMSRQRWGTAGLSSAAAAATKEGEKKNLIYYMRDFLN